jgi:hypothetical protein
VGEESVKTYRRAPGNVGDGVADPFQFSGLDRGVGADPGIDLPARGAGERGRPARIADDQTLWRRRGRQQPGDETTQLTSGAGDSEDRRGRTHGVDLATRLQMLALSPHMMIHTTGTRPSQEVSAVVQCSS